MAQLRYFVIPALILMANSALSLAEEPITYEQALEKVGSAISDRLAASSQRTATVLDFTNLENMPTQLGRLVAQDLTDKFVTQVERINWIDRSQRDFVLKENRLAADKLMDPATRKELGKLMGVDTIVVGTVIMLGQQVRLQARAIDIETARVLAVDSATFQLPESLAGLGDRTVSSTADSPAPNASSADTGGTFRNRVLAVQARSFTITLASNANVLGRGPTVVPTAAIEVENVSGQDIWIGVIGVVMGPCHIDPRYDVVSGVNFLGKNYEQQPVRDGTVAERRKLLTALPAGGKIVIVATSRTCRSENSDAFLGKTAPVSVDFVLDYGGSYQGFSAGIADFPITSNTVPRQN